MAEKHKKFVDQEAESRFNEQFAQLSDRDLAIAIRDFIKEALAENHICQSLGDINDAVRRLYPVISNIVFNTSFSHVRSDFALFNEIITFLVTRLARPVPHTQTTTG